MSSELGKHLARYGLRHFGDEARYWEWGGRHLSPGQAAKIEAFMDSKAEGTMSPQSRREFYDYLADPTVAVVVHSMKAGAIRASGAWIASQLGEGVDVLDVGCGLGYLTTWYSQQPGVGRVVGIDESEPTVALAASRASVLGVSKTIFLATAAESMELSIGSFGVIASTQGLSECANVLGALHACRAVMSPGGTILCVESHGLPGPARQFVALAESAGLGLQRFEFLDHEDLGRHSCLPAYTFALGASKLTPDWEALYGLASARSNCRMLEAGILQWCDEVLGHDPSSARTLREEVRVIVTGTAPDTKERVHALDQLAQNAGLY